MTKKKSTGITTLQDLIAAWKLNKELLAFKIDMPVGTFKNKLSVNQPKYKFTQDEEKRLFSVLRDMAGDIEKVAGITFNQALKNVIGK